MWSFVSTFPEHTSNDTFSHPCFVVLKWFSSNDMLILHSLNKNKILNSNIASSPSPLVICCVNLIVGSKWTNCHTKYKCELVCRILVNTLLYLWEPIHVFSVNKLSYLCDFFSQFFKIIKYGYYKVRVYSLTDNKFP